MREDFDKEYILGELEQIGDNISDELEVFLIGGGAMAFRNLKDATKDIDIVVRSHKNFDILRGILLGLDYKAVKDPEEEYMDLGAQTILENEDGCRFDVFDRQVVNKLIFSEAMSKRGELLEETGNLVVKVASPEDIFLFKSVAGRTDDIEDMNMLVQTGLDFDTVLEEIENQSKLLEEELFITHINEALEELEERFGVTLPLNDEIKEMASEVYDELEVVMAIDDTETVDELKEEVEIPENELDRILKKLEERGVIEMSGNYIQKKQDKL